MSAPERTILLVEDDEAVRTLVTFMLMRAGYNVLEAADPDEALAVADTFSGAIDLLLTDVVLPTMYGPKLAAALAARGHAPKTLYTTGYSSGVFSRIQVERPKDLVKKPFSPDQLLATVEAILATTKSSEGVEVPA